VSRSSTVGWPTLGGSQVSQTRRASSAVAPHSHARRLAGARVVAILTMLIGGSHSQRRPIYA